MIHRKTLSTTQFLILAALNGIILLDDLIEAMNNALNGNMVADATSAAHCHPMPPGGAAALHAGVKRTRGCQAAFGLMGSCRIDEFWSPGKIKRNPWTRG
jgi:hypothetical protein